MAYGGAGPWGLQNGAESIRLRLWSSATSLSNFYILKGPYQPSKKVHSLLQITYCGAIALVCWAGYYTDGLAANLSRLLNVEVLAASSRVSVCDGVVHLWNNTWPRDPSLWYEFFPDGTWKLRD